MAILQTAMIIDDDADMGFLLSSLLENRKILSMAVQSLSEAEQYLTYLKPNVIFLDNSFPEGLGINFIHSIKSADKDIKIVMLTGDPDTWIEKKACDEGVDYFIRKPVNAQIINGVLDEMNFRKE
jgi:response regulator of citrate/malate metabolism